MKAVSLVEWITFLSVPPYSKNIAPASLLLSDTGGWPVPTDSIGSYSFQSFLVPTFTVGTKKGFPLLSLTQPRHHRSPGIK